MTEGHMNYINQMKAVGNTLISSSADGSIKVWNMIDGSMYDSVQAHNQSVQKMIWAEDNEYMISVGREGTVKAWKFSENRLIPLGEFRGKAAVVGQVESRNGKIVIESSVPGNMTSKHKMLQICDFHEVIDAAILQ
jgi:WD40 repeat protein